MAKGLPMVVGWAEEDVRETAEGGGVSGTQRSVQRPITDETGASGKDREAPESVLWSINDRTDDVINESAN